MVVLILHPTEELSIVKLQKKLIVDLNKDDVIWYRQFPLWAEIPVNCLVNSITELKAFTKEIEEITLGQLFFSKDGSKILLPIEIKTKKGALNSELPLLIKLRGDAPQQVIQLKDLQLQIKQCQFGIAQVLHDSGTTVQSCKTSSYILQDSVWFKKSK